MTNPYSSPESNLVDANMEWEQIHELNKLASGQRMVIYSILGYFLAIGLQKGVPILAGLLVFAALITALIGTFRVAAGLKIAIPLRIILFIFMFMPVLNVLTILWMSSSATKKLRAAGYTVGFLGAKDR